jgi:Dockerin type I domain
MSVKFKQLQNKFIKYRTLQSVGVIIIVLIISFIGIQLISRSHAASNPYGDLNNDGVVNITDLSILLTNWGTSNQIADINNDGKVNISDLSIMLSHWGPVVLTSTCPSPTPVTPVSGYTIVACEDFNNGLGAFNAYNGGGGGTVVGVGRVPAQCQVSDGILHEVQLSNGATCGGSMPTFSHLQGLWEVRMRAYFTGTSGSEPHPVLILWPDTGVHADGELDYFEANLGHPARAFLHCLGVNDTQNCYTSPISPVDYSQWHVYSILWESGRMSGYIDGQLWWSTTGTTFVPSVAMHQTIQLDNLSGVTPVDPGEMDIDWVHMFIH